jgi:tetratricopeptide (TPR) repeat protein
MVEGHISVRRCFWLGTALALVVTGCTVNPPSRLPPVEERGAVSEQADVPQQPDEVIVSPVPAPDHIPAQPVAVASLVAKADTQQDAGDLTAAAATLERALRIDSGNATLWSQLAGVRLAQGQFWQAEGLAAKSNSLARNDLVVQSRNWRVIADARRGEGDLEGARQAEEMADSLDARARSNRE